MSASALAYCTGAQMPKDEALIRSGGAAAGDLQLLRTHLPPDRRVHDAGLRRRQGPLQAGPSRGIGSVLHLVRGPELGGLCLLTGGASIAAAIAFGLGGKEAAGRITNKWVDKYLE